MYQQKYYVDKFTGTSADTLLAVGFAQFLEQVLPASDGAMRRYPIIKDHGAYFEIDLGQELTESMLAQHQAFGLPMAQISTAKKPVAGGFDYEQQREIEKQFREALKNLPAKHRSPYAWFSNDELLQQRLEELMQPNSDLTLYKVINGMKSAGSFNTILEFWEQLEIATAQAHLTLVLELFAKHPNPYTNIQKQAKALTKACGNTYEVTLLQITNPTTGKGSNRPKGDKLVVGNLNGWWLLELLKFQGFFVLAHPQTIQGTKDRKNYLVHPLDMPLPALQRIVHDFRQVLWSSTPAKMDVLAILWLLKTILKYEEEAFGTTRQQLFKRSSPEQRVGGLHLAFYKDMGSAVAVMNVTDLHLPDWFPQLEDVAVVHTYQDIIDEHIAVVDSIKASDGSERTEEYELLRRYRDFLSGRSIEPFLDFCALFAPYVSQKIERKVYHRRFTTTMLNLLFKEFSDMKQKLTPIIENPGFQRIASAIRSSTVTLQYAKARNEHVPFEIRYGLTQDLVRQSNNSLEFMEALGKFVASYNTETARRYETSKGSVRSRSRIHQDDLTEITKLLDTYPARLIARMLVAFGTAKVGSKDHDDQSDSEPEINNQFDSDTDDSDVSDDSQD